MRLDVTDVSLCGRQSEMKQLNEILQQISSSTSTSSTTTNSGGSSNGDAAATTSSAASTPPLSTINESATIATTTTAAAAVAASTAAITNGGSTSSSSSSTTHTRALVTITGNEGVGKTSLVLSQLQQHWINEGRCLFGHGIFSRSKMSDTNNKLQFMAIFDAVTNLIQMWVHQQQDMWCQP